MNSYLKTDEETKFLNQRTDEENFLDQNTDIISSGSLFTNDELELLQQLDNETFVEFKDGQYYIDNTRDQNLNDINNDSLVSLDNDDWKQCPICHEKLHDLSVATSECPKCGAEVIKNSEDQELKKAGSGGFTGVTQPNYINCDSKSHIKRKLVNELKQKNYDSKKHMIPAFIIETAVDKFLTISERKIHRGSVQRGLKGMLIKYTLEENNMSKSTKVIGQIYGLTDKQLSAADALLRDYDAQGVIKINCLNIDRTASFINNYSNIFKIEPKYIPFINEIIIEADKMGIHLSNNFKPSTKATGAFLMFLASVPSVSIKRQDVIKESGLTSSTVNRYYNLLLSNVNLLVGVYQRWGIHPPVSEKMKSCSIPVLPSPIIFKLEPLACSNSGVICD